MAVHRGSIRLARSAERAVAVVVASVLVASIASVARVPAVRAADAASTVIARYEARIPDLMAEQGVPGVAVALVGDDRVLWAEGFGHLDGPDSAPVTPDTIFSVQSMSKLFTATAVMQAVAAGRLDLDAPITTYLPDFTVNSAFEQHPERKITLRMLLSHTAGFTFEAPIGNNNELDPGEFDAHVRSISETWLRYPVGTGYGYSNLGIDLAGYILERVEDKPFPAVMRDSLLGPLGMDRTTFDRGAIRSADNRAVGHTKPFPVVPLYEPMTAAGGMYSSAADLGRFLRFQLAGGSLDGRVVLDPGAMAEMRAIPAPHTGAAAGYALGVGVHRWNRWGQRPDLFNHGGGGYGFLSDLWWAPQLGVGVAVLTNSENHQLNGDLALSILGDLVDEPGVYHDRLLALPSRPAADEPDRFEPPTGLAELVASAAMPSTGDEVGRWARYAGAYGSPNWGVLAWTGPAGRFVVEGGVPSFETYDTGDVVSHRLVEVQQGVFLADNGETLDFRGPVPTWANLDLIRLTGGPAAWQWAVLGGVSAIAIAWLLAAAARRLRRRGGAGTSGTESGSPRRWRRVATIVATAAAILAVGNVALLVALPGLVDSGFVGWLELPVVARWAFHLPLAVAVVGIATFVLAAAGWYGRWWSTSVRLQYAALAIAMVVLIGQLAGWRLIGFGLA